MPSLSPRLRPGLRSLCLAASFRRINQGRYTRKNLNTPSGVLYRQIYNHDDGISPLGDKYLDQSENIGREAFLDMVRKEFSDFFSAKAQHRLS